MFKFTTPQWTVVCVILLILNISSHSKAQNIWLADTANSISLEFLKPSFVNENSSFLTGTYFLSARLNLSKSVNRLYNLNIQVPVSHIKFDDNFLGDDVQTALGNISISMDFRKRSNKFSYEVGVILPTVDEENSLSNFGGVYSDFLRFESFTPDLLYLYNGFNYRKSLDEKVDVRIRSGASVFIDNGERQDESELFLDYGLQLQYNGNDWLFQLGLTGRYWMTPDEGSDDNFANCLLYTSPSPRDS